MKQLQIILITIFLFQYGYAQNKQIEGDTIYWYKRSKGFNNKLGLIDLEKSTNEFSFRFGNQGQKIEITKDSTKFSGMITNYIYYSRRENSDEKTLFNKEPLSSEQASAIYNLIQEAEILNLPSDSEIENWGWGRDGLTYSIEYSDKTKYSVKRYWSPSSQKDVPVALKVSSFIDILSDTLQLQESYDNFQDNLPKRNGFYYNRYGTSVAHHFNSSLYAGYSGATKLPLGFFISYNTEYLGKKEVNLGFSFQYNFDTNGFHHLNFQAVKRKIFYNRLDFRDYIAYNYQDRKLNIDNINEFQNHQIQYGLYLNNHFGIGAGIDYLVSNHSQTGGHLYVLKRFSKPKIEIVLSSSVFANQINYKTEIGRTFYFNDRLPIRNIYLGLAYEDFMNYKDLYFRVSTSF